MEVTEGKHNFVVDVPDESLMESVLFLVTNATTERIVYDSLPTYTMNFLSSGLQDFYLSYLMRDAGNWMPLYSLHMLNDSLVVSAKAIVESDLGEDLKDVRLKLVAGPEELEVYDYLYTGADEVALAPMAEAELAEKPFIPTQRSPVSGELETLFIFELENRTNLEVGKVLGLPLFEVTSPIEKMFTWDAYFEIDGPVREEIRANNTAKLPWPNGKALLYRDGEYVSTVDMPYTNPGANASFEIGPTAGFKVTRKLKNYNISEEIKALSIGENASRHVKLTTENWTYLLEMESNTDKKAVLEVLDSRPMEAEMIKISPAPVEETADTLKWTIELMPREKREIEYTYRIVETEPLEG
jgi:hypothetical protein